MELDKLLIPPPKRSAGKRVWGISLEQTWIPYFTAKCAEGKLAIPAEALGAPLRPVFDKATGKLAFNKDGSARTSVVKEIREQVSFIRYNFEAVLQLTAEEYRQEHPEEYQLQVMAQQEAGAPVKNGIAKLVTDARAEKLVESVHSNGAAVTA